MNTSTVRTILCAALLAGVALNHPAWALDKEALHARMTTLVAEIQASKSASAGAPFATLQQELAQISASLGGDLPCPVGAQPTLADNMPAGGTPMPTPPTHCISTTETFHNTAPVDIPSGPAVVTSTIVVSNAQPYIWDVNLTTFIRHTFSADLDITITSPAGTVVTLTTDNGAGNDDVFNGTVWDDSANPGGQVPYVTNNGLVTDHAYVNLTLASPLVPEEALGAFIGEDPNGTWTLTISDDLAGDGGTLDEWSIQLATLAAAPTLDPVASFEQTTPVAIPTGPGVASSTLDVSGLVNPLCKVVLRTNMAHTFSADVDVTLMSPSGTIVTLTTDNGAGNDDVFNGTVWDDSANPGGQVPYVTNNGLVTDHAYVNLTPASPLVPEESMAAFLGQDGNGTWTITISDDLAGDGGNLASWSLDLTTCGCAQPDADLTLALSDAPDPVMAGTDLTYTATLTNSGPADAQDAAVSLPLPPDTTLVSATASAGGVCSGVATVTCTWAGVTTTSDVRTATVVVAVDAAAEGNLSATATASNSTPDPEPGNNTATADTTINTQADLQIAASISPIPVPTGGTATLTATSSNLGPGSAQDVVVTITLPAGLHFENVSPSPGGVCTTPAVGNPGTVSCTFAGGTAIGDSRSVVVTATAMSPSSPTFSTHAASTDPVQSNNQSTLTILLAGAKVTVPGLGGTGLLLLAGLLLLLGMQARRRMQ
ncbi:proprotein convertase P-domain-containing protein [Xanthomonadaceae bacterium JHOS43]|nr:proprotein convertase P-domain-containing protein [Xanthomonadaceae bacterium JHOS43]